MRIAKSEGAENYAVESYQHAARLMDSADAYATEGHSDRKELIAKSRETVQTAEDAREIAVKKIDEDRLASERTASADAQAASQAQADKATRQKERAQADAANAQDVAANAQADAANAQNVAANAQADAANAHADAANAQAATARPRLTWSTARQHQPRQSARLKPMLTIPG